MKWVERTRISTAVALVSLSALSAGFLEASPGFAKETQQPAVLTASAVAVADKYAADAA
jgi:gamma-glutamyltranspeptidase / glutathione hydrolase